MGESVQTTTEFEESLRSEQRTHVKLVSNLQGLNEMVGKLDASLPLFFDTETTGFDGSDLRTDIPVALQFHQSGNTYIVDVRKSGEPSRTVIGRILKRKLSDTLFVGHNLKFDLEVLQIHFNYTHLKCWDTMLAEQVIYGLGLSDGKRQGVSFSLKATAERRGMEMEKETRDTFKNMHLTPAWNEPFTEEQIKYMAQDVEVLPRIYQHQFDWLDVAEGQRGCFELEMEVLPALVHVEVSGVPVDWDAWMSIIDEKAKEADQLKEEVILAFGEAVLDKRQEAIEEQMDRVRAWEMARDAESARLKDSHAYNLWKYEEGEPEARAGGEPKWGEYKNYWMKEWRERNPRPEKPKVDGTVFNLNSPAQLLEAFKELGIPAKDTEDSTLEDLEEEFPIILKLRQYRKAAKFVQSFGEKLKAFASTTDGRVHPDYQQIGASTNRNSCKRPNWQQVPSQSETGQRLRKCVRARPGYKILTADFGSQEAAIMADLSGDETLLRLFESGVDLHSATARMMFNLGEDVDPKKHFIAPGLHARQAAKKTTYGIPYGKTEWGLSFELGIPVKQAKDLLERWYGQFPGMRKYFDAQKAKLFRGELWARTEHGWVRHLQPLPVEPVMPIRSRVTGNWTAEFKEYKEAKRAWDKLRRRIENQLMNTPIQGLGAGVTKRAAADFFFNTVRPYNERSVDVRMIALVHDELVVEVPEEVAHEVAQHLSSAMDGAMRFYLHRVKFPASDVHIDDVWAK